MQEQIFMRDLAHSFLTPENIKHVNFTKRQIIVLFETQEKQFTLLKEINVKLDANKLK